MRRRRLVTMSPEAHRALAAKWFLIGFRHSGAGFHGERYDVEKYPSLESILLAEFSRVYDED